MERTIKHIGQTGIAHNILVASSWFCDNNTTRIQADAKRTAE
uniref:Uncharacterized protein n=1 Tax=Tetraselmis sp. GSL018 TaxID=582737 RepID=A0A061QNR5_9CHLO